MAIFWFLMGLAAGLALGIWRWRVLRHRLQTSLSPHIVPGRLSSDGMPSQLSQIVASKNRALEQYQDEIENLQQVLESSPTGYLQVDEENRLFWCNAQASHLLGIDPPFRGPLQQPRLLLELVRSFELDSLIDETRQSQTLQEQDWILYRVSPDPFHPRNEPAYPMRGYGIPLARGKVAVFLENRQEANTLIQQRDRWTSDVAHELKTPLTSIRLVAETLRARVDTSLQGWLDRLLNETIRLSNLVEDLLNLSRLGTDNFQGLNLKPTNLVQLVQTTWLSLEPLARIKRLKLDYHGPPELFVNLDQSLFSRVLINLIDNAIKHSPPQSAIYVRLGLRQDSNASPEQRICLEVIDVGLGFNEKDIPYIFDRFYRADPSRKRTSNSAETLISKGEDQPGGGTGLGLSIVQQILYVHQGSIEAANHPDLGGGWLRIYLPECLLV